MRTIVYHFEDLAGFESVLREGDQELPLPVGEVAAEGEWVLAMFEVGARGRATAAAGRGTDRGDGTLVLVFERRDWERLQAFASTSTLREAKAPPVVTSVDIPITVEGSSSVPPSMPAGGSSSPVVPPPPASVPSRPSGRFSIGGSRAAVLVVDDDPGIREVVGTMLESVGIVVEVADSGEAALERVRAATFDLVVLDWNLPGMTGIDVCRHIRREPSLSTTPILFLTAHASSKDVVEAFACGADDYVVKPFRAPELGARVFGLLRRARATRAIV